MRTANEVIDWAWAQTAHVCDDLYRLKEHGDLDYVTAQRVALAMTLLAVIEGVAHGTDNRGGWGDSVEAESFLREAAARMKGGI